MIIVIIISIVNIVLFFKKYLKDIFVLVRSKLNFIVVIRLWCIMVWILILIVFIKIFVGYSMIVIFVKVL